MWKLLYVTPCAYWLTPEKQFSIKVPTYVICSYRIEKVITNKKEILPVCFIYQVQPKHVKEAFRLLNKSIIRVEQPVINFDDEEEEMFGEFYVFNHYE